MNKLKIYSAGIITGFWMMFIYVTRLDVVIKEFGTYPLQKQIIGIIICTCITIFALRGEINNE